MTAPNERCRRNHRVRALYHSTLVDMYSFDHTAIPTRSITPLLSIKTLRRGRPACRRTARSPFLDVQSILKYADLSCVPIEDIEPESEDGGSAVCTHTSASRFMTLTAPATSAAAHGNPCHCRGHQSISVGTCPPAPTFGRSLSHRPYPDCAPSGRRPPVLSMLVSSCLAPPFDISAAGPRPNFSTSGERHAARLGRRRIPSACASVRRGRSS
jgi:hypothetical protein